QVPEVETGAREHGAHVRDHGMALLAEIRRDAVVVRRSGADAGEEQQVADAAGVGVGTDGLWGIARDEPIRDDPVSTAHPAFASPQMMLQNPGNRTPVASGRNAREAHYRPR